MKNLILTGSFAAMLLLGACNVSEELEESVSEDTSEEVEADTVEESTEEESTEQVADDGTSESSENSEEWESEEEQADDAVIKSTSVNETVQLDTLNMTVNDAAIGKFVANDMDAASIMKEDVAAGQEVEFLAIGYTVENTTDDPRTFYLNQAEIITSTGEQIDPELLMADGIQSEMNGAITTEGVVVYMLKEGTGKDVEWIDVMLPTVSDGNFNFLTEEQKYRIEF